MLKIAFSIILIALFVAVVIVFIILYNYEKKNGTDYLLDEGNLDELFDEDEQWRWDMLKSVFKIFKVISTFIGASIMIYSFLGLAFFAGVSVIDKIKRENNYF